MAVEFISGPAGWKTVQPWFAPAKMKLCCALAYPAAVADITHSKSDKPCTVELMNAGLLAVKRSGTAEEMI